MPKLKTTLLCDRQHSVVTSTALGGTSDRQGLSKFYTDIHADLCSLEPRGYYDINYAGRH